MRIPSLTSSGTRTGINNHGSNQNIERPNNISTAAPRPGNAVPNEVVPAGHEIPVSPAGQTSAVQDRDVPVDSIFCSQAGASSAESTANPVTVSQGGATPSSPPWSFVPPDMRAELLEPRQPVFYSNGSITADGDPFAEYFSDSPDGQISIPDWIIQKYFEPAVGSENSSECIDLSNDDDSSWTQGTTSTLPTRFLPFDKIIGCSYPEEAAIALDWLYEDRQGSEPNPKYETQNYVLAEVEVGSQIFQGLGNSK